MTRVLVTGCEGQLGRCLQKIAGSFHSLDIKFMDSKELDITDKESVISIFKSGNFDYCINCAAFTDVEEAERNPKKAFNVNSQGAGHMAYACQKNQTVLIHISTDYVFDGKKIAGYITTDLPNPINKYGSSKLEGEEIIRKSMEEYFIIRTSWLYSEYGNNFYTNILKKAYKEGVLFVTDDQIGCPTNANNLAKYIYNLIVTKNSDYGIYHFTDNQAMTWYDFAKIILIDNKLEDKVRLEKVKNYRTLAQRPKSSILISRK